MYRASRDSLCASIAQLEAELRELRALRARPRPRERVLWAVTVASMVGGVLAATACMSARMHAEDAERRFDGARVRLERKTADLATCEDLAFHELRGDRD